MKITFDRNANAIYIYFDPDDVTHRGKLNTVPVDENIVIDYTQDNKLYGIEILSAGMVDLEKLKSVVFEDITGKKIL